MNPSFGGMFGIDPNTLSMLASSGALGFGPGMNNAMGQMWQVNQGNQNADMYLAGLQNQMDMLNAQLGTAQNMQNNQLGYQNRALGQGQQNLALQELGQLANTRQLGGIFSNMFNGLGNAMGGLFGGLGGMFGGGGSPLNMHSSSGAGISFGGGGGGGQGGGGAGGDSGGAGGGGGQSLGMGGPDNYGPQWGKAYYGPLYTGDTTTPMTNGRNISMPNAYGGGMHAGTPIYTGPTDPTGIFLRNFG